MTLIKSVINLITFLIMFGLGVESLDMASRYFKAEAVKAHKRGVMSLYEWNSRLHKQ